MPTPPKPDLSNRLVLLVDDNYAKEMASQIEGVWGCQAQAYSHYHEAYEAVTGDLKYDLLIVDHSMGVGDGLELARLSKEKHPKARVVLMSGHPNPNCGYVDLHLRKPFSFRREPVLSYIQSLLEKGKL